jgi:hypothetical protein
MKHLQTIGISVSTAVTIALRLQTARFEPDRLGRMRCVGPPNLPGTSAAPRPASAMQRQVTVLDFAIRSLNGDLSELLLRAEEPR